MANKETDETVSRKRERIRKHMDAWRRMDDAGRRLGRGLGRREMIVRVARETGATQREVEWAIKGDVI